VQVPAALEIFSPPDSIHPSRNANDPDASEQRHKTESDLQFYSKYYSSQGAPLHARPTARQTHTPDQPSTAVAP